MTTKTEPTNKQVAEALEWEFINFQWNVNRNDQFLPPYLSDLPDFTHDLNASWKYVWPALVALNQIPYGDGTVPNHNYLSMILWEAYQSPNPAMYFAIKLWKLKGK